MFQHVIAQLRNVQKRPHFIRLAELIEQEMLT
jgi:hypothetical protein